MCEVQTPSQHTTSGCICSHFDTSRRTVSKVVYIHSAHPGCCNGCSLRYRGCSRLDTSSSIPGNALSIRRSTRASQTHAIHDARLKAPVCLLLSGRSTACQDATWCQTPDAAAAAAFEPSWMSRQQVRPQTPTGCEDERSDIHANTSRTMP